MSGNMRDASRQRYACSSQPTMEEIRTGAIQRIADALENMAAPYVQALRAREYYERAYRDECESVSRLLRSNRALRGAITRAKRRGRELSR